MTIPRPKSLSHLGLSARGGRDPHLEGLTADSRAVRSGFLFAALPGSALHGATYIATAIEAGAAAILTDALGASLAKDALDSAPVALVVAEDPREALARAVVRRATCHNGGGYWDQWQNLDRDLLPSDLDAVGPCRHQHRHHGRRRRMVGPVIPHNS